MNRIKYQILKHIKEKQYLKYIDEHRENVEKAFEEMVMCPDMDWIGWEFYHVDLYDRVQTHDLSKYDIKEFNAYRKKYYPINDEERELNEEVFEDAWENHYSNNRHHWQCRIYDPEDEMTKDQQLDCLENVLDWMAMGYKYNDRPYQYYERNKTKMKMPKVQRDFIEKVIYEGVDKQYIEKGK